MLLLCFLTLWCRGPARGVVSAATYRSGTGTALITQHIWVLGCTVHPVFPGHRFRVYPVYRRVYPGFRWTWVPDFHGSRSSKGGGWGCAATRSLGFLKALGRLGAPMVKGGSLRKAMYLVASCFLLIQGGFCRQKHSHRNTDSKIGPRG